MARLVPACVWRTSPELVLALDGRFGTPVDSYVNGSQVWLRDDGPGGITVEWRLHPVASFRPPAEIGPYELFETVTGALATGEAPAVPVEALWDGLEAFAAYGDEVEPGPLAGACTESLGIRPDGAGLVDHESIGSRWERSERSISIVAALLDQLASRGPGS